jgi:hypothetical protein
VPAPDTPALPHCRDDPPWTDCGDPRSPDFGLVFARRQPNGAVVVSFDRAGLRHALTLFSPAILAREIVIYGRRFGVTQVFGS